MPGFFSLASRQGANQLAITLVQIVMNNTLGHYGELSSYGRDIPLACVGIISKVSAIFNAVIFGISQSTQPILGYNYGAETTPCKGYLQEGCYDCDQYILHCISLLPNFPAPDYRCFRKWKRTLLRFRPAVFSYFPFLYLYCRCTDSLCTVLSIYRQRRYRHRGIPQRQVFFLLPLVIIFPLIWGIDGVLWAEPRCRWLVRHFGAASCPAGNEKVVNKPCFPNIFS